MINVALLTTGNEVINGEIIDTNAAWCSVQLVEAGFNVNQRFTVSDDFESIRRAILLACSDNQIVIVNGGLGPTTDDLTSEAAAAAAGCALKENQYWIEQLDLYYKKRNREMPKSNLKQAKLPEIAEVVENPYGTACGFYYLIDNTYCYFTPGVPHEFKAMMTEQIIPDLHCKFKIKPPQVYHRFYLFGLGESMVNDMLQTLKLDEHRYEIGFRASTPFIELKIRPKSDGIDQQEWLQILTSIKKLVGNWIVSENQNIAQQICNYLEAQQQQLILIESTTAGFANYYLQSQANNAMAVIKEAHLFNSSVIVDHFDNTFPVHITQSKLNPILSILVQAATQYCSDYVLISMDAIDNETDNKSEIKNRIWIGLITPSDYIAAEIVFVNNYSGDDKRKLLTTMMLDLMQRYWAKKELFNSSYTSLNVLEQCQIPRTTIDIPL